MVYKPVMWKLGCAAVVAAALAACGKSKCEKYADMEWKCGHYPEAEKSVTKMAAEAFCEASDDDKKLLGPLMKAEVACAKYDDCESYVKCKALKK
jgi:hypothetical protein